MDSNQIKPNTMMKNLVLLMGLALISFQSQAQFFTRTYSPGDGQSIYSMRGYDLTLEGGKYYYSAGNEEHKVIFEVDPNDGSIAFPATKVATFSHTGSKTGIGKNSAMVVEAYQDPEGPIGAPFNLVYLTGKSPEDVNEHFNSHGVTDWPTGMAFNGYLNTNLLAQSGWPNGDENYWLYNADYSDQTHHGLYRYMVGGSSHGAGNGYSGKMYAIKHHNGTNTDISAEFVNGTGYEIHPDVPVRTINDPVHGIMTAFGGAAHNGTNYIIDPIKMDPGMWVVDHGMNTNVFKTYHNASGNTSENLGVAQSVINTNVGSIAQHSLIVASGNNPESTTGNSDKFQMGRWGRDCFHLIRDWDNINIFTDAFKLSFAPIMITGPNITFERVQVGDIVEVDDGFIIVGSFTRTIHLEDVDGDGNPIMLLPLELEQIFMMKLDKPAGYPAHNRTLTVGYAKFFLGLPINPADIDEIQANRVKVIDNEVFIIGSYSSTVTGTRTPLLIKTDIDNQLAGECAIEIMVDMEGIDIVEVSPEQGDTEATPKESARNYGPGIQREASSIVQCDGNQPFEETVGIAENDNQKIDVFPSPAQNQITITGLSDSRATLSLVDVSGKVVLEYSENVSETHIMDVSSLNKGVYILQVRQNGQLYSRKVVKD